VWGGRAGEGTWVKRRTEGGGVVDMGCWTQGRRCVVVRARWEMERQGGAETRVIKGRRRMGDAVEVQEPGWARTRHRMGMGGVPWRSFKFGAGLRDLPS
jgi:hypothetical protein